MGLVLNELDEVGIEFGFNTVFGGFALVENGYKVVQMILLANYGGNGDRNVEKSSAVGLFVVEMGEEKSSLVQKLFA